MTDFYRKQESYWRTKLLNYLQNKTAVSDQRNSRKAPNTIRICQTLLHSSSSIRGRIRREKARSHQQGRPRYRYSCMGQNTNRPRKCIDKKQETKKQITGMIIV